MDCCKNGQHNNTHSSVHDHTGTGGGVAHYGHSGKHNHTSHFAFHDGDNMTNFTHGVSAQSFLRRFLIVTFLLAPLMLTNKAVAGFLHLPMFGLSKWIQLAIATVIFGFSLVFFQHAKHEIAARRYGMMTLVSLAVGAGYAFSVVATFIPSLNAEFYLEIATLIWVLLFGHYLEARSGSAAGDALAEVAKLLPKKAHRISDGNIESVDITLLAEGDTVLVKPGEKVPADGIVTDGKSNVNESLISGESKPVARTAGSEVVAGSIALDGSLTIRLSRVGERSMIGQIQQLIAKAQQTKPNSQRIADRAAAVLTFVAIGVALVTLLVWSLVIGEPLVFAATLAITVLVIACPHALGLAIPTVTTITTSLAVRNGVFIKDLSKIETIKRADYIVFDKTGTLSEGKFGVTDVAAFGDAAQNDVIRVAASLEQHSSHIIGQAVVSYAKAAGSTPEHIADFQNAAGKGVRARISSVSYSVGNQALMKELGVTVVEDALGRAREFAEAGKTAVFVADSSRVLGVIALADKVRQVSAEAVRKLHSLGIKVAMLTGDNEEVAKGVAKELGIETYFAEVLPEDKYKHIKSLQGAGNVVLMVGDGVNDAPALTQSDVGIAVGAGTDVAVEAGDVVLTKSNPKDVVRLVVLSRKVYSKMVQNLVWAFGYNVLAIPAAAGVFAPWGFFLRPEIGALLMSASTVIVVINAVLLRRLDLKHV